jgi:hypothetical protein
MLCRRFVVCTAILWFLFAAFPVVSSSARNEIVQLAWFYKPPLDGQIELLKNHFQTYILTKMDEPFRDRLKMSGVNSPFLQYLRLDAIDAVPNCEQQPHRNQVADQIGDYCTIRQQHRDWFLLDKDGNPIIEGGYAMMDPGNQEWRNFWLQRAKRSQEERGWDGVFLDNVEGGLAKRKLNGPLPSRYPKEEDYQNAVEKFVQFLYTSYFRPSKRPLEANIVGMTDANVWLRYLNFLDGAMNESFAVDWEDGYRSSQEWLKQLELAEKTQSLGKRIILVSQGKKEDKQREQFSFCSYLLVAAGRSSFRYTNGQDYRNIWIYENYSIRLGDPVSARYKRGDNWCRDFTNGSVMVNPVSHASTIRLRTE